MISSEFYSTIFDHLWQSTVVVGVAWLLTLALRKNHARVRYWVWMASSVKFLLPFSLLMTAGEWVRSLMPATPVAQPAVANAVEQVTEPFNSGQLFNAVSTQATAHHSDWLPFVLLAVWACGALMVFGRFARGWWTVHAAKQAARPLELTADVPVLSSPEMMEPGVFGIMRPVLLLPEGILERLTAEQMRTIVAHEMAHVRRRDNLTFALHMLVEALFWFHPLVWWIGSRLIDERERACDEAVVETGSAAQAYAEGILTVCKFYVESPLECVAGVTGADLKKRILRIMTTQMMQKLSLSRKLLLGVVGFVAATAPLVIGLVYAGPSLAETKGDDTADLPKFDVVSIKPHKDEGTMMRAMMRPSPDGFSADGMPLEMLIRQAFDLPPDRILNLPDWVKSARYDIEAKVAPEDAPRLEKFTPKQRMAMLVPVLEERFGLKLHHDTKDLNVYTLIVAKGGPKLTPARPDENGADAAPPAMKAGGGEVGGGPITVQPGAAGESGGPVVLKQGTGDKPSTELPRMMMRMSTQGMTMEGHSMTMAGLTQMISQQIGSTVVDKTALTGKYDFTLSFMPDMSVGPMMMRGPSGGPLGDGSGPQTQDAPGPSIFAALPEQLGLKLESQRAPVDVVVIDRLEQPSAN